MKYLLISSAITLALVFCSTAPSESDIQTAIAQTQTSTPIDAVQRSETLEPSPGSTKEAQDITNDVEKYVNEIAINSGAMSQALTEISHLISNPKIGNEQWYRDLAVQMETIQLTHQEFTEMEVPIGLKEAHSILLDATGDCNKAMDYLESGIDYLNLNDIELATDYMVLASDYMGQCVEKVPLADQLIEEFLNELE